MDPDDRLRYLFASAFSEGLPSDDCPTPDRLYDAWSRTAPPEERVTIVEHLASCPVCAEAWRLLVLADR